MIINMTGGSGGGAGASLTVNSANAGTVTVSNSTLGKSYAKTVSAGGSVVFKGLATGTWTVTLSASGQTPSTKTVNIIADYATSIAFFTASIVITYPANSSLTVKDNGGNTVATDTNTTATTKTYTATVRAAGTYTITATATDGSGNSSSGTAVISSEGQSVSVELSYWHGELYTPGNQWESVTGGWQSRAWNGTAQYQALAPTLTFNAETGYMDIQIASATKSGVVEIQRDVNLTDFATLSLTVANVSSNLGVVSIVAVKRDKTYWYTGAASIKYKALSQVTADAPLTTTVEDLTGDYDILIGLNTSGKAEFSVSDVHLE